MRIALVQCDEESDLHIWSRHRVTCSEAAEAAYGRGLIIRGRSEGLYEVYGRSEAGRYLTVIVRSIGNGVARLITAREMNCAERRRFEKHTAH